MNVSKFITDFIIELLNEKDLQRIGITTTQQSRGQYFCCFHLKQCILMTSTLILSLQTLTLHFYIFPQIQVYITCTIQIANIKINSTLYHDSIISNNIIVLNQLSAMRHQQKPPLFPCHSQAEVRSQPDVVLGIASGSRRLCFFMLARLGLRLERCLVSFTYTSLFV